MVKSNKIQSISYTLEELRPIRASVDQCRVQLSNFIEKYKSVDLLELEMRLLSRCVYKNWNARHAELGIQASRRVVRFLERFLAKRERQLEQILSEFKPDAVHISLPSRGTLNQLISNLQESSMLLSKAERLSKTTVDRLRLECSRGNYVHYNILIMSLCSRIYFLVLALDKTQQEFCTNMPGCIDYARFLSRAALRRQPSAVREATQLFARSPPSTISFASGSPNTSLFPFKDATITLTDDTTIHLDSSAMAKALQYLPTPGQEDLLQWLKKLQNRYHSPIDFKRYELCITNGSMEGLSKVFELILNYAEPILVDSPCYSGSLDCLRGFGADVISINTDANGMSAQSLHEILSNWSDPNTLPRVLYTIPNGSNPTGASMNLERKKEIYAIAQKYNLIIIEDDPYYFLQFQKPDPSFLSMDTDGRVIRLDSMSKVLSAGMRLGFVTAPVPLCHKLVCHQQVTSMHASALSQMVALKLFEKWDLSGFHQHTERIAEFYGKQKTLMVNAIRKHLKGMVTFNEPKAGMFVWLKVNGVEDTRKLIYEKALAQEVLLLPGSAFFYDQSKTYPYVRVSYSISTPEQIETGMARFGKVLREELNK
ncbi:unnamed protein product [Adineta ricciae]|uniref:Aminotransferase class I/classII domain-containing protein n=2 Tax=Adineta ricciae TaxID=249248 RepID=A0A814SF59_ADIRI|nr:unnamed protein product [Adineta ricciae]